MVTYALDLQLAGNPVIDFLFVITEVFFRYLLRLRRYKRISVEVGFFRRGGHLSSNFTWKGHRPLTAVGVRTAE